MGPTFSVVIPVYKTEQHLARCLQSVVSQSFQDFEIIVADDGSDFYTPGNNESYMTAFLKALPNVVGEYYAHITRQTLAELAKMTGHAQYLSAELAKYEQSRIIRLVYRLKTRICRLLGKAQ